LIRARTAAAGALLGTLAAAVARPSPAQPAAPAAPAGRLDSIALPFAIGEKLVYGVVLAGVRVGMGSMEITGADTVRGHHVWHSKFHIEGGIPFFRVNDDLESWFDPVAMISYKFTQRINEGGYHRVRLYDFYPDKRLVTQEGRPDEASVAEPLDDGAFFYFVRTVPLAIGETHSWERYFKLDRNPVIVKVLRRDTVTVDAGRFACIVIQPIIKSSGIFAEGGEALMWLSDDPRHMLVQMKTKVPILKSLDLYLKTVTPGGGAPRADSVRRADGVGGKAQPPSP
jgi:hypothetical protein